MSTFAPYPRTVLPEEERLYPDDEGLYPDHERVFPEREDLPAEHHGTARRGNRRPHRSRRLPQRLGDRRLGRRGRRFIVGSAVALSVLLLLLVVPISALDGPLTGVVISRVSSQVSSQMSCPGTQTKPPKITIGGGRLVPQLLLGRLSEIKVQLPDMAVSGVQHADFSATLRDVSVRQPKPGTTQVGRFDAAITLGFANMPSLPGIPQPTFGRAADGSLTVALTPTPEMSKNVKATVLAKLELHGASMSVVPQQLVLFGKSIPAAEVADQTGGARTEKLPDLPAGLAYKSVAPKTDGLHVALGGTVTTPLSELPTSVGEQTVSYQAVNGQLGISTSKDIPLLGELPLTIFTEPTLGDGTLTLVPKSVDVLGSNRQPSDPIAAIVLSQVKQEDLTRTLPELPSGVKYQSVSVDSAGIKVTIDGVTVQAFSGLPKTIDGRAVSYGAKDGMLVVTTSGATADHPMSIVLYSKPAITGTTLDLVPERIQMLGATFPARDVLATIKTDMTKYPLQTLPAGLSYRGVEVLASGLRITVGGRNVQLTKGALGGSGASC